jgi:hypothetical protein
MTLCSKAAVRQTVQRVRLRSRRRSTPPPISAPDRPKRASDLLNPGAIAHQTYASLLTCNNAGPATTPRPAGRGFTCLRNASRHPLRRALVEVV